MNNITLNLARATGCTVLLLGITLDSTAQAPPERGAASREPAQRWEEALDDLDRGRAPELWAAAREATRRRIHSGGEVSSHGRAHMGLAAAHLEMAEEAYGCLEVMATGASMCDSLMCSHEPRQRIFNLDANGAMPEIVNRMLVRSHPGSLDLLPALPPAWRMAEAYWPSCGAAAGVAK